MSESVRPLQELVAEVATAYFTNTLVAPDRIVEVMSAITQGLVAAGSGSVRAPAATPSGRPAPLTPEQIRQSITPEALISFEDGKKYKLLRRHLRNRSLTPSQYRAKWGLPPDYPMVAPACSARRSAVARGRAPTKAKTASIHSLRA
jgi:predicted transcriptional regulator